MMPAAIALRRPMRLTKTSSRSCGSALPSSAISLSGTFRAWPMCQPRNSPGSPTSITSVVESGASSRARRSLGDSSAGVCSGSWAKSGSRAGCGSLGMAWHSPNTRSVHSYTQNPGFSTLWNRWLMALWWSSTFSAPSSASNPYSVHICLTPGRTPSRKTSPPRRRYWRTTDSSRWMPLTSQWSTMCSRSIRYFWRGCASWLARIASSTWLTAPK